MKKTCKTLLVFLCLVPCVCFSQVILTKEGKPQSRIIVDKNDPVDYQAAKLLQDFMRKISSAELPIMPADSKVKKGDILIGNVQESIAPPNLTDITEDGFYLSTKNGYLRIKGEGNGTIYGAVTLLEDYFCVCCYAQGAYTIPQQPTLILTENINRKENPTFRFRQTQAYSLRDSVYKMWHRLETPREEFAANMWVHTFDALLPSRIYGESHPEYYALINGEHRPGWASQWCLTNPDVFDIVSQRIDSIFKANPDKHIISVSQNDGHDTYCTCNACMEINNREGSLSGSLIWFVNKLAERFPDKQISTLAYMYTVEPPKHIKPLPNVNIMLCNIECSREVTLEENETGNKFVKDMEGWSAISDNIFVWDYGIDFDSYLSPFPNFHVMKPNMELFKKNKTTMHFSQIGGSKGGDFSELRSYIAAKLMWNISLDTDSLIKEFLHGYYGEAAAPYLYDYIKLREGALMGSNLKLNLYDTPVSHKTGMLNHAMLRRYIELFDKAEVASSTNEMFYQRVKEARLPVQYSELEIAHTNPISNPTELETKLDFFQQRARELNVSVLHEMNGQIDDYCTMYKERYLTVKPDNLALGAKVQYLVNPTTPHNTQPGEILTDAVLGAAAPSAEWIGWQGMDGEFILDLGEEKEISRIELDFLQRLGSWALLPKGASWYYSIDNENYTLAGQQTIPEDRDRKAKCVKTSIPATAKVKARYIKVHIESIGLCPSWHLAVGHPAWFMIDEVSAY